MGAEGVTVSIVCLADYAAVQTQIAVAVKTRDILLHSDFCASPPQRRYTLLMFQAYIYISLNEFILNPKYR